MFHPSKDEIYVNLTVPNKGHKRHFVKPNEIIQLSDCSIVVSTEWGIGNIDGFISLAESLDFAIETSNQ